jgi:hypothetical protein
VKRSSPMTQAVTMRPTPCELFMVVSLGVPLQRDRAITTHYGVQVKVFS